MRVGSRNFLILELQVVHASDHAPLLTKIECVVAKRPRVFRREHSRINVDGYKEVV